MMSGKPEQQPIQNVVVYVSAGDNFAHSYSVGQQNVAFQHPQNGGFASAAPITCKKSGLKAEFVNGSSNPGGLYTPPSVQPNGYPGANLAYGGSSAAATILKNLGGGQHVCGHIESLSAGSVEEQQQICSYASPALAAHPRICAGTAFIDKEARGTAAAGADADVIPGNYVAAVTVDRGAAAGDVGPRGFVALCGEGSPTTTGALVPPGPRASSRCDSARSEAAESSCSSLSSDGQQETGNSMIQGPSGAHPVVCRTGQVALAGQILLQGGPPQGIAAQLASTSSASGQAGLHFSSQSQHHPQTPHPEAAVQSYIACPGGGVVLGNQTVVLNGQQALGGAAGHHAGQQSIGNLVLTMTVPQLVPTGALTSGGQVLQAFTTVGSLASTGPLAPPTVTLAHSATHGGGGPINSQPPLLSVHPSLSTPPSVGVSGPVVVNSSLAESTTSTPGISIPFGWKRLLSTSGSIVYVSPSSTQLTSLDHVKEYLQTQGTCKCGLECPLKFETVFNFDPKVPSKPWSEVAGPLLPATHDLAKLCSHKRKMTPALGGDATGGGGALANQRAPSSTTAPGAADPRGKKDIAGVSTTSKRKKRKAGSPYEGASVPQIFATKDQQGGVVGGGGLIQTFPRPLLQPHRLNINPSLGSTPVASGPMVSESHSALLHSQVQFQQNQRPVAQLWNANERDSPTPVRTPILPALPTSNFGPSLVPVSSSNIQSSTSSPSSTTPAVNFHLTGSVGYGAGGILVHSGSNGFTPGGSVSSGYGLQGMSVVGGRIMFGEDIQKGQSLNPETLLKLQQHFPPGARLVPDEGCKVPRNLQHHHFVPNGIVAAPSLEAFRPQLPQGQLVVDGIGVRTFQTQPNISIPATIPHSSAIQAQTFDRASVPHHQQWEDVCKRKKGNSPNFVNSNITNKVKRTKYSALERESSPCPNVDVRQIPMEHRLPPPNVSGSYTIITARNSTPSPSTPSLAQPHSTGVTTVMGVPSFMEDPTAYLAQQTALLNSTISRQTGGNIMFGGDAVSPSSGRQASTPHANPQTLEANHSGLISSSTVGIVPLHSGIITTKASSAPGKTASVPTSCALPKSCSNAHMTNLINTAASATVDGPAIQSFISTSPSLGGCHQTITTVSTTTSTPVSVCQSQVTSATVKSQNIIYQTQNSKMNAQVHHQQLILRQPLNEFVSDQIGTSKDQRLQQTPTNNSVATGLPKPSSGISNHNNPHQLSENQFLQVSSPNQIHQHILQTGSNFSVISSQGRHQIITQHQSPDDNPVTSSTFLEKAVCQQKDVSIESQHLQVSRSQSVSQSNLPAQFKVQQMPVMDQGALQVYPQQQSTHFIQSSQNQHHIPDSRGPIQGGTVSTSQTSISTQGGGKADDVGSNERSNVMIEGYSVAQVGGHQLLQQETSAPSSTQLACQALDGNIYITSTSTSGSSNGCDQKLISVSSAKSNVGQYSQSPSVVTTMASGHTVSSNTITSVQAGKAPTITVSGGNTSTSTPPSSSPASHYSFSNIPTTQAFVTVSSSSNSKSPLEMVQSVVSSIQVPCNQPQGLDLGGSLVHPQQISMGQPAILKTSPTGLPPGHFLVSNGNGQFIVASATGAGTTSGATHNGGQGQIVKFHPPSSSATSIPLVATQPVMQLVNALPVGGGPPQLHLLQHHPQQQHQHCHSDIHQMAVGLPVDGSTPRTVHTAELVGATIQQPHLQPQVISPGISKRKGKKRKPSPQTVASMLHIATQHQQQQGQLPVGHHHTQQQVVMPGSTTGYGAPGGMLQAVAFVPGGGKFLMNQFASASSGGAPASNGTPTATYGTIGQQVGQIGGPQQHLLTAASSSQALHTAGVNLLQPLSLSGTPGTATLLQNFPFQQLIGTGATVVAAVPGIQGMVMSALPDGTLVPTGAATSNPDASNQGLPPLQLHLQNLNGQNVLTQVQPAPTQNIFGQVNPHQQHSLQQHPQQAQPSHHHQLVATGAGSMVIRGHAPSTLANSQHHHIDSKVVQQQTQPVLSQGQFLVNSGTAGNPGNPGTLIPHGSTIQGNHQITVNQPGLADSFVGNGGAVLRPSGEFLQCSGNVLVPISQQQQQHPRQALHTTPSPIPHGTSIPSTHQARAQVHGSQQNTTVVQQNTTTIVQQQTMMVSNNHSSHQPTHPCHSQAAPQQQPAIVANYGAPSDIDPSLINQQNVILEGGGGMTVPLLHHYAGIRQTLPANAPITISPNHPSAAILLRHSVSTQTAVNQSVQATSPPVYVTTVQSSNQGLLSASTCYVPSSAPPLSRPPPHSFGDAIPQTATVQSSSELVRGNGIMASAGSPPDTTTHSATASPADTTTSDVASNLQTSISSTSAASTCLVSGSTEGFAPSGTPVPNQSLCGVSPTRNSVAEAQCSVHFVSSSEPEPSPSGVISVGLTPSSEREQEEGGDDKGRDVHSATRSGPERSVSNSSPRHDSAVSGSAPVTSGFVPLGVCGDDIEGSEGGLRLTRVSDGEDAAHGRVRAYVGRGGGCGEKPPPVESTVVVALGYTGLLQNEGKGAMRDVSGRDIVFVTSGDHVDGGKLCTSSADVRLMEDRGIKGYRRKHSDTLVMEGHSEGHTDADEEECTAAAAATAEEMEDGASPRVFAVGDLVWGQVRGCPSWPGKLVSAEEAGMSRQVEGSKVWVRWFGDQSLMQVEAEKLKTLSEGLEAHHRARKKYRKGRKMNTQLENAIQEAMVELDRMTEEAGSDGGCRWKKGGVASGGGVASQVAPRSAGVGGGRPKRTTSR